MKTKEVSARARQFSHEIFSETDYEGFIATNAKVCEFLRKFAGGSAFLELAKDAMQSGIPEGPRMVYHSHRPYHAIICNAEKQTDPTH
jgi:hypothetical protein